MSGRLSAWKELNSNTTLQLWVSVQSRALLALLLLLLHQGETRQPVALDFHERTETTRTPFTSENATCFPLTTAYASQENAPMALGVVGSTVNLIAHAGRNSTYDPSRKLVVHALGLVPRAQGSLFRIDTSRHGDGEEIELHVCHRCSHPSHREGDNYDRGSDNDDDNAGGGGRGGDDAGAGEDDDNDDGIHIVVVGRPGWSGYAYIIKPSEGGPPPTDDDRTTEGNGGTLTLTAGRLLLRPNYWVAGTVALEVIFPPSVRCAGPVAIVSGTGSGARFFLVSDASATGRARVARSDLSEGFQRAASWGMGNSPKALLFTDDLIMDIRAGERMAAGISAAPRDKVDEYGDWKTDTASQTPASVETSPFYALDGDQKWHENGVEGGRCEIAPCLSPWWQVRLRHPALVVEVSVALPRYWFWASRPATSIMEDGDFDEFTVGGDRVPPGGVYLMLATAKSRRFASTIQPLTTGRSPPSSAPSSAIFKALELDASISIPLRGRNCHAFEGSSEANGDDDGSLVECKWKFDSPLEVSFIRVHGVGGGSLKLAEVGIIAVPKRRMHPILQPHSGEVNHADNTSSRIGCDIELYRSCPGTQLLVTCLNEAKKARGALDIATEVVDEGLDSRGAASNVQTEATSAVAATSCSCFARALECYQGPRQASCHGRNLLEKQAEIHGCGGLGS
jgi:hypothetical protein